ncbi:Aste57867_16268 [Aphanomyces stellatus]|uniref:Aste57867_16268 protein n=2 Tax=Aphanomyces stellatus TaxID=120398 RepID=A0A485L5W0_9STRA|nr:hypothetical protein As57867_016211 [Aphanomyces stellatus]VFT93044.1 Aste57867_16268 [Aphanomyces stellatus]
MMMMDASSSSASSSSASSVRRSSFNLYNATILDLHLAASSIQRVWRRVSRVPPKKPLAPHAQALAKVQSSGESVGQLLVVLTTELAALRTEYADLEAKHRRLFYEMEAQQHEKLDLRTQSASEEKRLQEEIRSLQQIIHTHLDDVDLTLLKPSTKESARRAPTPVETSATAADDMDVRYWHEALKLAVAQETQAKEKAHAMETRLTELQAKYSMLQDECRALRAEESQARLAVVEADQQRQVLQDALDDLQDTHDTTLDQLRRSQEEAQSQYTHWMQSQTKLQEAVTACNQLQDDVAVLRSTNETLRKDNERMVVVQDEVAALKRTINGLKGTVTAKTAEAKAFQAYGSSAREHLQTQGLQLQKHTQFQTQFVQVGAVALAALRGLKHVVIESKDMVVAWQSETLHCFALLQTKLATTTQFVHMAHIEHKLLRHAMLDAKEATVHLHEQLWKIRRNALMVCQVINTQETDPAGEAPRRATANYDSGELLYRQTDDDDDDDATTTASEATTTTLTMRAQLDTIFSNRGREWTNGESVSPAIQSVLDGYNACVVAFEGQPDIETNRRARSSATTLVLHDLFEQIQSLVGFCTVQCSLSYLGIYSEHVYDLLSVDRSEVQSTDAFCMHAATGGANQNPMIVLDIRNADEADIALDEGLKNFDKLTQEFPTMHRLTHRILTVCVTTHHLFDNVHTNSKLQIVELCAGDSGRECTWQDTERIRATISAENSLNAFTTCLSEIRVQDPSFVRYHCSKLTLLLQDCLNVNVSDAKLLLLCTIKTDHAHGLRLIQMLQLFRAALHPATVAHDTPLSLDLFLNRFPDCHRFHVTWQAPQRPRLFLPWEDELQAMKDRNALVAQESLEERSPCHENNDQDAPSTIHRRHTSPAKALKKPKRKSTMIARHASAATTPSTKRAPFR